MATASPNQNTGDVLLEGLEKGLKYVYHGLRAFLRFLGIVFIDKLMRAIVLWYDKMHGREVNVIRDSDGKHVEDINKLRSQLKEAKDQIEEKKSQNSLLQTDLENTKNKVKELSSKTSEQNNTIEQLQQQINGYIAQIDGLESEKNELMKHSMSPNLIPATILYAEGDASSSNLRKVNICRQPSSLYEIHTIPGNYAEGTFYAITPNNPLLIIENRSIALRPCRIDHVEADANTIVTIVPGKVKRNGKDWDLIEYAVIKLIKQ